MSNAYRAPRAGTSLRATQSQTNRLRAGVGLATMALGVAAIACGAAIAALVASPSAPSIEGILAIRIASIAVFSFGAGLWPLPGRRPIARAVLMYCFLVSLYLCALMVAATVAKASWPGGLIVGIAAIHCAILVFISASYLRRAGAAREETSPKLRDGIAN